MFPCFYFIGNFNSLIQLGAKLLTKLTDQLPEGGLEALGELDLSSVRRRRDTVGKKLFGCAPVAKQT